MTLWKEWDLDIQKKKWKISYRNEPSNQKSYILNMKIDSMRYGRLDKEETRFRYPRSNEKQRGQKTWKISYKNQPGFKKSYMLDWRSIPWHYGRLDKKETGFRYPKSNEKQRG